MLTTFNCGKNALFCKPKIHKFMSWVFLIIAGLCEVGFTSCLVKYEQTEGWISYGWFGGFLVSLTFSMWFLIIAAKSIPMGTAYAVFAGVGAVGTALMGIFVFNEATSFWRIFFIVTLVASIVGLNLVSE